METNQQYIVEAMNIEFSNISYLKVSHNKAYLIDDKSEATVFYSKEEARKAESKLNDFNWWENHFKIIELTHLTIK